MRGSEFPRETFTRASSHVLTEALLSLETLAKSQFKPSFLSKVSVLQRSMILTVFGFDPAHI